MGYDVAQGLQVGGLADAFGDRRLQVGQMAQKALLGIDHHAGLLGLGDVIASPLKRRLRCLPLALHLGSLPAVVLVIEH